MSDLTIVDTDILIDAALGITEAVEFLEKSAQTSELAISIITQMELYVGCRNKTEMRRTERFIHRFRVLKLDEKASDVATDLLRQYRLSHNLAIPDALIAATAIALEQPFASKNQRDYRFLSALRLLPYPASNLA
jgi:hypothetical protein